MKYLISVFTCLVLFASCKKQEIATTDEHYIPSVTIENTVLYDKLIQTSADLFLDVCMSDLDDLNQVISPLSIQQSLNLLSNGASDGTLEELHDLLHLRGYSQESINQSVFEWLELVENDNRANANLRVSNAAIWDKSKIVLQAGFVDSILKYFDADTIGNNFTVDGVNAWADMATDGLIKEVLQEIKEEELLFLINAIVFKGDWLDGFDEQVTTMYTAQLADGTSITYPMMHRDYETNFIDDNELQVVRLPFQNENYDLIVLQPKAIGLNDYLKQLGSEGLSDLLKNLTPETFTRSRLLLNLPKFEVKLKKNLNETLQRLGMVKAFDPFGANLQNIGFADGNLFVSRVLHDTYFKLDEKGVEGAAVTVVGIGATSLPPAMTFDKPFLLCLRHTATGVPIFIGKIGNPADN